MATPQQAAALDPMINEAFQQYQAEAERLQTALTEQEQELNDLDAKLGSALRAIGLEHADNARLTLELTHRVGWEERCLRAEADNQRLRAVADAAEVYRRAVREVNGIKVPWAAWDAFSNALDALTFQKDAPS